MEPDKFEEKEEQKVEKIPPTQIKSTSPPKCQIGDFMMDYDEDVHISMNYEEEI